LSNSHGITQWFFCEIFWGPRTKLQKTSQNFEIQGPEVTGYANLDSERGTNLIVFFVECIIGVKKQNFILRISKFKVPRVTFVQIPNDNREMKGLLNEFHHGKNLMALLYCNLEARNKIAYSEF
jgi:hypothetical protein